LGVSRVLPWDIRENRLIALLVAYYFCLIGLIDRYHRCFN
jgi:fatty-acid desaturase